MCGGHVLTNLVRHMTFPEVKLGRDAGDRDVSNTLIKTFSQFHVEYLIEFFRYVISILFLRDIATSQNQKYFINLLLNC